LKRAKRLFSGGRYLGSFQHNPGGHIFPEGDQQLSRQSNDQHFPNSATIEPYALMKPQGQYRTGLMPYPQPGELDRWIMVVRRRGFPALETPCSCATDPLRQGVGANPA
jgi:hypothetical protein